MKTLSAMLGAPNGETMTHINPYAWGLDKNTANFVALSPLPFLERAAQREVPCAFVELKGGSTVSEPELIDFCRPLLARFKLPKQIVFGELPKTSTGKIQQYVLRERVRSRSAIE